MSDPQSPPPPPRAAAGPGSVLGALLRLGGFTVAFIAALAAAALFVADATENLLVYGVASCLAALVATLLLLGLDGRRPLAEVGLHRRNATRHLGRGLVFGVVIVVPVVVLAMAGGLRYGPDGGTVLEYLGTGAWTTLVLFFLAAGEEILFRGYPLTVLAERWGNAVAVVVTTLAFSVLHGSNPEVGGLALFNIALAGFLLGVVRIVTGSLWAATGVHLGCNLSTGFLADLPVSGLSLVDAPLIEVVQPGRAVITGGAFGVEGGLASTATLVAAIAWVVRSARRVPPAPGPKDAARPASARPSSAQPSSAEPSSAEPSSAEPSSAEPFPAQPPPGATP